MIKSLDFLNPLFQNRKQIQSQEYREGERLSSSYFEKYREVVSSGLYSNVREVTASLQLKPGRYVLVPSTYEPQRHGDYLVRMYTEKPVHVTELWSALWRHKCWIFQVDFDFWHVLMQSFVVGLSRDLIRLKFLFCENRLI